MHPCTVAQLDLIRAAIESGKDRREISELIDGYWLEFLSFDSVAHAAAIASEVSTHMPGEELAIVTTAYAMMPTMDRTNAQEAAEVAKLRALRRTGGPLTEGEASQVLWAVESLRNFNQMMWISTRWALPPIRKLGPLDPSRMDRFMGNARCHYGDCVKDLAPDWPKNLPLPRH